MFDKLQYDKLNVVEVNGCAGGIWVASKSSNVQVSEIQRHEQVLHLIISATSGVFILSTVYSNPAPVEREKLWDNIKAFYHTINEP